MIFADVARRISLRSRQRKFRLFMEAFHPDAETTIVDVGVVDSGFGAGAGAASTHNFLEALYPWPAQITAVGLGALPNFQRAFPEVKCVTADGRDLPFADDAFDIAFSNAVVEHVGDAAAQRAFVGELCRVARRIFVTTPNRWFPIDVHTLLPAVHWLPQGARTTVLRRLGSEGIAPLGPRQFRQLFPLPVRIVNTGIALIAIGQK
jgi:SAM-dependent methyltransferase